MGAVLTIVIIVFAAAVLVWNFIPGIRDKLRGWTTILEGVFATLISIFGQVTGALQDAEKQGYLPHQLIGYLPYVILLWMLYKRLTTTGPVGTGL